MLRTVSTKSFKKQCKKHFTFHKCVDVLFSSPSSSSFLQQCKRVQCGQEDDGWRRLSHFVCVNKNGSKGSSALARWKKPPVDACTLSSLSCSLFFFCLCSLVNDVMTLARKRERRTARGESRNQNRKPISLFSYVRQCSLLEALERPLEHQTAAFLLSSSTTI